MKVEAAEESLPRPTVVRNGGPWQGPALEEWIQRIAKYSLNEGETLPFIKRQIEDPPVYQDT